MRTPSHLSNAGHGEEVAPEWVPDREDIIAKPYATGCDSDECQNHGRWDNDQRPVWVIGKAGKSEGEQYGRNDDRAVVDGPKPSSEADSDRHRIRSCSMGPRNTEGIPNGAHPTDQPSFTSALSRSFRVREPETGPTIADTFRFLPFGFNGLL